MNWSLFGMKLQFHAEKIFQIHRIIAAELPRIERFSA